MGLHKLTIDELLLESVGMHKDNLAITWKNPEHSNVEISELEATLRSYKRINRQPGNRWFGYRGLEAKIQKLSHRIEEKKWLGLTYGMLLEHVESFAKGLRGVGLTKGDRIAILGDNTPQWLIASLGVQYLGGIAVPLPPQIIQKKPKALVETNRPLLEHNQPKAIVIDQEYYDMMRAEAPGIFSSLQNVIVIERGPMDIRSLEKLNVDAPKGKVASMKEILHAGKTDDAPLVPNNDEEDIAMIVYTSGTTGDSVGVMHTHRGIFSNVLYTLESFPLNDKSRLLSTAPFAHVLGLLLCGYAVLRAGARYVLYSSLRSIANDTRENRVTHLVSFPQLYTMMFNRIYSAVEKDKLARGLLKVAPKQLGRMAIRKAGLGSVKYFVSGGAKLDEDTFNMGARLGLFVIQGYGLTEAPVDTVTPPRFKKYGGSVGLPLKGIEPERVGFVKGTDLKRYQYLRDGLKIRLKNTPISDQKGARGIVQEVLVSGANLSVGFFKDEAKTEGAFWYDENGRKYLKTGDLGTFTHIYGEERPLLTIIGRLKSIIVLPNGKNINPEEIEGTIKSHSPLIGECRLLECNGKLELLVQPNYSEITPLYNSFGESVTAGQLPQPGDLRDALEARLREEVKAAIAYIPSYANPKTITMVPFIDVTWTRKVKRT